MLIKALHVCTVHSVEEAQSLVSLLVDFLSETEYHSSSNDVIMYLREVVAQFPAVRGVVLQRLCQTLPEIHHSRVLRG